jgi:hypothetical protein
MAKIAENGWWEDSNGDYKHPATIDIDRTLEDELVEKIHEKGKNLQAELLKYKAFVYSECYAFIDELRSVYGIERLKGKTERVTLRSFNGTKEFKISVNNLIDYNPTKIELAREKFLEYANLKVRDVKDNDIKTIVLGALTPKNGRYDDKELQKLINWGLEHPLWQEGVDLINKARMTTGTKSYINLRQREGLKLDGRWEAILLDLAALPVEDSVIQKNLEFIEWMKKIVRTLDYPKYANFTNGFWRKLFDEDKTTQEAFEVADRSLATKLKEEEDMSHE